MSENLPTNVQLNTNQNGSVTFAADVVSTIAGLAATEVEGVTNMVGSGGMLDILGRRGQAARGLTKGVKVEVKEGQVAVQVSVNVDYGMPIPEVAVNIQENVKKAVETMSGLTVSGVDVNVQGISFEKEMRAAAEIEMQQRVLLQKQDEDKEQKQEEPAPAQEAPQDQTDQAQ